MNTVRRLIFINFCILFLAEVSYSYDSIVLPEETITLAASCSDTGDCDTSGDCPQDTSGDSVEVTWSARWNSYPYHAAGTFPSGNTGTSVQWKAPSSPGEVLITSSCDDVPPTTENDSPDSDSITILVTTVDIDIWNALNGASVADDDEEKLGAYLLVNWDDDNVNDDPDLDETGTVIDENDLSKITLSCNASSGTLSLTKTGSNIKLWQDPNKGTEQTTLSWNLASTSPPSELWVEGTDASGSERDVELELKLTVDSKTASDKVKATVVMINLGNAVYQENQLLGDPGHAALVTAYTGACTREDLLDADKFQITEMPGPFHGVETDSLSSITENDPWGCFAVPNLTYSNRLQILQNAYDALHDGGIGYDGTDVLNPNNWDDTIANITELRCDGLVEMCYEIDNLNVWGHIDSGSTRYDIENNTYQNEHNDSPGDWTTGLAPATQCARENTYRGIDWNTTFTSQGLCAPIGHQGH